MTITLEQLHQRLNDLEPTRRFDPFSRRLEYAELMELYDHWRSHLGLVWMEKSHLRYIHHRLLNIENQCAGRMAGDVREAVLRMMVAISVPGGSLRMLEIGTLFGVSAAATWDIASGFNGNAHVTVVDPLDGYYGPGTRDPATGLLVTPATFHRNLDRLGVPASERRVVRARSEAPEAVRSAAERTYNFMVIDGDHSYEGVLRDWKNYGPQLEEGGYAIFDNYRDESWPEVTRAVDEIASSGNVAMVGLAWRTAVLRRESN
jgi:predicted O-methyltransferase YrrM